MELKDKACKSCKSNLIEDEIFFKIKKEGNYELHCRRCMSIHKALYRAKSRAKEHSRTYALDYDWAVEQLKKQDNKCYWTRQNFDDRDPLNKIPRENVLSIDRKQSNLGYTPDNAVFCVNWFNVWKSDLSLPELHHKLQGYLMAYAKIREMDTSYLQPFDQVRDEYKSLLTTEMEFSIYDLDEWVGKGFFESFNE